MTFQPFTSARKLIVGLALLGTPPAVHAQKNGLEALAKAVDTGNPEFYLHKIYHLETGAKPLGPRIVKWLEHDNWEVRNLAARSIGSSGYQEGRIALENLLSQKTDWRLAHHAARSLAQLGSLDSLPSLKFAADSYWFPIVKKTATASITGIKVGPQNSEQKHHFTEDPPWTPREHLSRNYDDHDGLGKAKASQVKELSLEALKKLVPKLARKITKNREGPALRALDSYGSVMIFPFQEGQLVGVRSGEWGGSISYVLKNGQHKTLLAENTFGIASWNGMILVATGYDHGGASEGHLYRVLYRDGKATIAPWFVLPGRPRTLFVNEENKLVSDNIGGALVFSTQSDFKYLSKKP